MCTAITYRGKHHYFGRNLDLEGSFRETVTVTPRNYPFLYHRPGSCRTGMAIIGMASVIQGYPLYYDATNEAGLSMAGLNFPGYAHYHPPKPGFENLAPYELIPRILGHCDTVDQARKILDRVNVTDIPFHDQLPLTPLHWLLADREKSIVLEPMEDGLRIHEDPVGVLTNSPPFDYHMLRLTDHMGACPESPENRLCPGIPLQPYSRGMGMLGIPGDLSSASRFVKAAYAKFHSVSGETEESSVSQFFHILGSVRMIRGSVRLEDGSYEITQYTSCSDTDRGIYYYTTYENSRITAVDMHRCDLNGNMPICFPLERETRIEFQN